MSKEIVELKFDSVEQLNIFFNLANNPKGLTRNQLIEKFQFPRTTMYNKLQKLMKKTSNSINYVQKKYYNNLKRGRPLTLFYVPEPIINYFFTVDVLININGLSEIKLILPREK